MTISARRFRRDAQFIQRLSRYYGQRFEGLIERLNRAPGAGTDLECVRLCVEAVNMMLTTQARMAGAIEEMEAEDGMEEARKVA